MGEPMDLNEAVAQQLWERQVAPLDVCRRLAPKVIAATEAAGVNVTDGQPSVGSIAEGYPCPKDGTAMELFAGGAWCPTCRTAWREIANIPYSAPDDLFGRVEQLEGYLSRMADALQEDGYEDDTVLVDVLASILAEAGWT